MEGQISEQSFEVSLDGWGEVTFASFEPKEDGVVEKDATYYGDVRFMLLKGSQTLCELPGVNAENRRTGQQFGQVLSVAFRDYNEDGREDILIIMEYAGVQGPNLDVPFREVRVYTQEEGEKDFVVDVPITDYLNFNSYSDNMELIEKGPGIYAMGWLRRKKSEKIFSVRVVSFWL